MNQEQLTALNELKQQLTGRDRWKDMEVERLAMLYVSTITQLYQLAEPDASRKVKKAARASDLNELKELIYRHILEISVVGTPVFRADKELALQAKKIAHYGSSEPPQHLTAEEKEAFRDKWKKLPFPPYEASLCAEGTKNVGGHCVQHSLTAPREETE